MTDAVEKTAKKIAPFVFLAWTFGAVFIGYGAGQASGRRAVQFEAVKAKVGGWVKDEDTGKSRFVWLYGS